MNTPPKCDKCDAPAVSFYRDGATMHYACGEHVAPVRGAEWQSMTAVGGAIHAAEKAAADIKKSLGIH